MSQSSTGEGRRTRRAFVWIAVVALILAAALSGAWYVLAGRLDLAVRNAVETAGRQGVALSCENQSVFGYPFRLGLRCDALGIDAPHKNLRASGGALRTAAQIYEPTKVVAELDAPVTIAAEGAPPLDLRWDLAQASAHFRTEGLDRFSLVVDALVAALGAPEGDLEPMVRSDRLEVHARRRDGGLALSVSGRRVRALAAAFAALPAFDIAADMTIDGAADWLSGRLPGQTIGEALAGRTGTVRVLRIAISAADPAAAAATGSAEVSGPFQIAADGTVSGNFDLTVANPHAIASLVGSLAPQLSGFAGSVASAIGFAGETKNGRTTIRITVTDGAASLGVLPLGTIPPLR